MRTFTYVCNRCQHTVDQEVPGVEPPPSRIEHPHDGCPEMTLMRVWISVRINGGYDPHKHGSADRWAFKHG